VALICERVTTQFLRWNQSLLASRPNRTVLGSKAEGYVTTACVESEGSAEIAEKHGRHVGTRTPDLYRVKVAL
jgi:hypothetical protein